MSAGWFAVWPLALLLLAAVSSALWYGLGRKDRYRLDVLALIASGAAVMSLVDAAYGYLEEGVFMDLSWSAVLLGVVLVVFTVVLWVLVLLLKDMFK
ncbi:MAG: hypothetical protein QXH02_03050 [Desulfurococcaceae archaeon]